MLNVKKLIPALLFVSLSVTVFATPLGVTAFSATQLTTNATDESIGQTSVQYTVTNNATKNIPNISIAPNWNSSAGGLSLSNDTCSGQTLTPAQSCTFDVAIPGRNQPSSFTLQPKVCGFNGNLCSQAASTFPVSVVQHTLPVRVYEVIFPSDISTEKLVGINIANTSDIIQATVPTPTNTDGPLAISPDGSKVYMSHSNGDGTYSLLVFTVTTHSLSLTDVSYALSYSGHNLSAPGQIAITPDGNTLYITDYGYSGTGYPVYRIDLTNPNYSTAVTGISDDTDDMAISPKGIVVSSDGKTVYLANSSSTPNNIFSFPNSSTTTSLSTIAHETDLTAISALLISSDNSTLYAAGQSSATSLPAVIEQYNIADNFSVENTFSPTPDDNGSISSATLSPDNTSIYTIVNNSDYLLYSVNTATMTAPAGTTFPYHTVMGVNNHPSIAYSPDGSAVSILNYGASGNLTALFNPSTPSSVTTVNPAISGTMYTHTWGSFIN